MNLVIYTYGYGEGMFNALNAIKMIINTTFFQMLLQLFASASVAFAAVDYATNKGMSMTSKPLLAKVAMIYFVFNFLVSPRADVTVHDRVTNRKEIVSNLPRIFIPIGWLEGMGDLMAGAIEQAFTPVGNDGTGIFSGNGFSYRNYGLAFGAQMMRESKNWRITNPEFALNMDQFIQKCVVLTALKGNKYTLGELHSSLDPWGLVRDNAGGVSRVTLNIGSERDNLTCYDAGQVIDTRYFRNEIAQLKKRYLHSPASKNEDSVLVSGMLGALGIVNPVSAGSIFMHTLEKVHGNYLEVGNGENIIKQQLMMASLSSFDASHANYAGTKAKMLQESAWTTTGLLAAENLPMIYTLAKSLMYAGLIFLIPMILLAGGITRFKLYLMAVASLQLWPSLYAILNMFIEMYTSSSINSGDGIISYATYSTVGHGADKIAAVAGSLQIFIPYICYQIMQGSLGGFVHLAGGMMSSTQSAAQSAASEIVSGERRYDNISLGTQQIAMQSGFKTDLNSSYSSGGTSIQHSDGASESVSLNNTRSINSTHMKDQGIVSLNVHDQVEHNLSQRLDNEKSTLHNIQVSKRDAESASLNSDTSFLEQAMNTANSGKAISFSENNEDGKNFKALTSAIDSYAKQEGISSKQAVETVLRGKIGLPGVAKLLTGLSSEFSTGLGFNAESANGQTSNIQSDKHKAIEAVRGIIERAATNDEVGSQYNINKETADNVTASHGRVKEVSKQEDRALNNISRLSNSLEMNNRVGGTLNKDSNHEAIALIQANHESKTGHKLTHNEAFNWFNNPQNNEQSAARDNAVSTLYNKQLSKIGGNVNSSVAQFDKEYSNTNNNLDKNYEQESNSVNDRAIENKKAVIAAGDEHGINKHNIENIIDHDEMVLNNKNSTMKNTNNNDLDKNNKILNEAFVNREDSFNEKNSKITIPMYNNLVQGGYSQNSVEKVYDVKDKTEILNTESPLRFNEQIPQMNNNARESNTQSSQNRVLDSNVNVNADSTVSKPNYTKSKTTLKINNSVNNVGDYTEENLNQQQANQIKKEES